ncbi:adhesion G protein-coupled receptor E3-like [Pimephales promelas]|nr:adhesion G protein-coupled receptor E3-like [Pimephales promelas]
MVSTFHKTKSFTRTAATISVMFCVLTLNLAVTSVAQETTTIDSHPVDPCFNYNVLDNAWRATNRQSYIPMCDQSVSWSGWYRLFLYGFSVQIPDTCVEKYRCSTTVPLWIRGGHPKVEDGVVSRDVCGHWDNYCCYYGSFPIKVKACPGNYFVYELVRPTTCNFAYCADVSSINTSSTAVLPAPISTDFHSADPCYHYTVLDDPWRANSRQYYSYYNNYYYYNYNCNNYYKCDTNVIWSGWYRLFINGLNAHIPDTCVEKYSCGTEVPLWIHGGHPTVEDGVVTRDVCGHYNDYCCYYGSFPIKVKACPGNYYVYELVRPTYCCSTYCADTGSINTSSTTVTPVTIATVLSVDPCYNYTVLDDPRRATSYTYTSSMCDISVSWSGWYRLFYYGLNVQIPDTCVATYRCGTAAPLWIRGGHPTIEDGVVTRDVCSHWSNNCCIFGSFPIKIKACPGNYYVYELVSPTLCNSAYCADKDELMKIFFAGHFLTIYQFYFQLDWTIIYCQSLPLHLPVPLLKFLYSRTLPHQLPVQHLQLLITSAAPRQQSHHRIPQLPVTSTTSTSSASTDHLLSVTSTTSTSPTTEVSLLPVTSTPSTSSTSTDHLLSVTSSTSTSPTTEVSLQPDTSTTSTSSTSTVPFQPVTSTTSTSSTSADHLLSVTSTTSTSPTTEVSLLPVTSTPSSSSTSTDHLLSATSSTSTSPTTEVSLQPDTSTTSTSSTSTVPFQPVTSTTPTSSTSTDNLLSVTSTTSTSPTTEVSLLPVTSTPSTSSTSTGLNFTLDGCRATGRCENLLEQIENITAEVLPLTDVTKILDVVLNFSERVLVSSSADPNKLVSDGNRLLKASEKLVSMLVKPTDTYANVSFTLDTLEVQVFMVGPNATLNKIPRLETKNSSVDIDLIGIAKNNSERSAAVAFMSYNTMENLLKPDFFNTSNDMVKTMMSTVISATLPKTTNSKLTKPVNFTLKHIRKLVPNGSLSCVYWNISEWIVDGCSVLETNSSYTVCSCVHLSTFALIMQTSRPSERDSLLELLKVLNLVCVPVGLVFFSLALLTFAICQWSPGVNNVARINLCISLLLAHLLFLLTQQFVSLINPHQVLCAVISGVLHFLFLSGFVWMLIEAVLLFICVKNLSQIRSSKRAVLSSRFLCVIGYVVGLVVVGVSAVVDPKGYGSEDCWIKMDKGFFWSFLGPVAVIIALNMILFINIIISLNLTLKNRNPEVSQMKQTKTMTFKTLAQFVVLGCSWILGFFTNGRKELEILFLILNSQQGTFIFLVYCVLNNEVRQQYRNWWRAVLPNRVSKNVQMRYETKAINPYKE